MSSGTLRYYFAKYISSQFLFSNDKQKAIWSENFSATISEGPSHFGSISLYVPIIYECLKRIISYMYYFLNLFFHCGRNTDVGIENEIKTVFRKIDLP